MLSGYETLLFGCAGLFILCTFIWLCTRLIIGTSEIVGIFMRKFFPRKYYYDYEEEV